MKLLWQVRLGVLVVMTALVVGLVYLTVWQPLQQAATLPTEIPPSDTHLDSELLKSLLQKQGTRPNGITATFSAAAAFLHP